MATAPLAQHVPLETYLHTSYLDMAELFLEIDQAEA